MESARMHFYAPEKSYRPRCIEILEHYLLWSTAAFIFAVYTGWTLYKLKRPSLSIMESITLQSIAKSVTGIVEEGKDFGDDFVGRLSSGEEEMVEIQNDVLVERELLVHEGDAASASRTVTIEDVTENCEEEDVIIEGELDMKGMYFAKNSRSNSEESSSTHFAMWSDDCNTIYEVSDTDSSHFITHPSVQLLSN